jgi:hypothetical protein
MTRDAQELIYEALALPEVARVDQRIAKALLIERGGLGSTDRRLVDQVLERLTWRATLKPSGVGVAAHGDAVRDYSQLVVAVAVLREPSRADRLIEVIHRALAQPLVVIAGNAESASLSVGLKRRHEREAARAVLERLTTSPVVAGGGDPVEAAFLHSLALAAVPAHDLWSLHTGWEERIEAFAAARITGAFRLPLDGDEARARQTALANHTAQAREVVRLKTAASAEKRLARRLDLAREVASAEGRLADLIKILT